MKRPSMKCPAMPADEAAAASRAEAAARRKRRREWRIREAAAIREPLASAAAEAWAAKERQEAVAADAADALLADEMQTDAGAGRS